MLSILPFARLDDDDLMILISLPAAQQRLGHMF
jgi:hypothetical protein